MKTSEVISILMKSVDKGIEIVIDNRFSKFCFESYVRGFHVYQTVWSPIIGAENLECRHEEKNEEEEFAISVDRNDFQNETLVEHVPRNISRFVYKFLKLPNSKLSCKVKGKRLNRGAGYGLEIAVIHPFNGHEQTIEWLKSKIQEDIKLEQSMKNRCLG